MTSNVSSEAGTARTVAMSKKTFETWDLVKMMMKIQTALITGGDVRLL